MIVTDYEKGYQDGHKAALRKVVVTLEECLPWYEFYRICQAVPELREEMIDQFKEYRDERDW